MRSLVEPIISLVVIVTLASTVSAKEEKKAAVKKAEEEPLAYKILIDKIAPPLIRTMATAYVHSADIDKAKAINKEKIINMDEEWYRKRLAKICSDLKGTGIDRQFGIKRDMEKEETIRLMESFTKERILVNMDKVPNQAISKLLRRRFKRYPDRNPKSKTALIKELNRLKNRISKKIYSAYKRQIPSAKNGPETKQER